MHRIQTEVEKNYFIDNINNAGPYFVKPNEDWCCTQTNNNKNNFQKIQTRQKLCAVYFAK